MRHAQRAARWERGCRTHASRPAPGAPSTRALDLRPAPQTAALLLQPGAAGPPEDGMGFPGSCGSQPSSSSDTDETKW